MGVDIMNFRWVVILTFLSSTTGTAYALSPAGQAGKQYYPVCNACHNPTLEPPLAPPMWGIQRRYQRIAEDKAHFIDLIADFAKEPTLEKVQFRHAIPRLGLMPPVALPEQALREVATYIAEEAFPPPCTHWEASASRAQTEGDSDHARQVRRMLQRFCGR